MRSSATQLQYARSFETISSQDVKLVGGKNASLGEMVQKLGKKGIRIPNGFATTADAYLLFLDHNHLTDRIHQKIDAWKQGRQSLQETGKGIRRLILKAIFPEELETEIGEAYRILSHQYHQSEVDVAVRSSATAEDLPKASFAGQQESYLNINGEQKLLETCRKCYASLFTDRAITYRDEHGFDQMDVALSIGVQKMVRSDKAGSGVMFTLDPETGFRNAIVINAAWGLGENVVKGRVNPDEYMVFKNMLGREDLVPILEKQLGEKEYTLVYASGSQQTTRNMKTLAKDQDRFVLADAEILELARWATIIEQHYERPMDIEWAKDGESDELYIVQARPETVQSQKQKGVLKTYVLKQSGKVLLHGLSVGNSIASGKVRIVHCLDRNNEPSSFEKGNILVTEMTDPDWIPLMKRQRVL
jgi:pyruvate,water dikinase